MAVRDDARDSEPVSSPASNKKYLKFHMEDQHHDLQSPIPTQQRTKHSEPFTEIDWFRPTSWELKRDKSTLSKGVLAEAVHDVGKAAQAMQIWASEAGVKMKQEEDEYHKFTKDMDSQQLRADNLHAKMKEEIEKKDKVRMKLMKIASAEEGPHLYFSEDDLKEKEWHKDEPEHTYTLEELGLEDAQDAEELEDESESSPRRSSKVREQEPEKVETNDWLRLLARRNQTRRGRNSKIPDSPFTAHGAAVRQEKFLTAKMEEECTDTAGEEFCLQNRHQCQENAAVHEHCRRVCGDCRDEEVNKQLEQQLQMQQETGSVPGMYDGGLIDVHGMHGMDVYGNGMDLSGLNGLSMQAHQGAAGLYGNVHDDQLPMSMGVPSARQDSRFSNLGSLPPIHEQQALYGSPMLARNESLYSNLVS
jgi:hypothetical protein